MGSASEHLATTQVAYLPSDTTDISRMRPPRGRAVPQTPCLYPDVWQVKVMATMVASGLATEMSAPSSPVLLLEPGDRLSREEFERRYERMPDVQKAELIEGIVYLPSPAHARKHSGPQS